MTAEPEWQPRLLAGVELRPGVPERLTGAVRVGTVVEMPGSPLSVYGVLLRARAEPRATWL